MRNAETVGCSKSGGSSLAAVLGNGQYVSMLEKMNTKRLAEHLFRITQDRLDQDAARKFYLFHDEKVFQHMAHPDDAHLYRELATTYPDIIIACRFLLARLTHFGVGAFASEQTDCGAERLKVHVAAP